MPDRKHTRWMYARLYGVSGMLAIFAGLLAWRMWYLQVKQNSWLSELSQQQVLKSLTLEPLRGPILDRNGAQLAVSTQVDSAYVVPGELGDIRQAASRLASALGLNKKQAQKLQEDLSRRKHFAWVARRLLPARVQALKQLEMKGLYFTKESRRFYPGRELAAHLLGFVGDGRGLEGLELQFDDILRGSQLMVQGLRDAYGRMLVEDYFQQAQVGGSLVLTIDSAIQEIVERELEKGLRDAGGKAALAVVLSPASGEVLAMAGLPTFNPNVFQKSPAESRRNRAVTDCFEPGSTIKTFTMAGVMEAGLTLEDELIDCNGGVMTIGRHTIRDAHLGLKKISATEVLAKSSNVGIAQLGQRLGKEKLHGVLSRFGFGQRTGIELPGESACVLRPASSWPEVTLATVSFGQGMSANILQLAAAMGAVANGGVWMQPQIIKEVRSPDGRLLESFTPHSRGRVISARTASRLTRMLIQACMTGGTGTLAAVPGITVAGKTGTAQKVDPLAGGYSPDKRVASFLGFAPADSPRLVIAVVIDEPTANVYGGVVAAPVFARIAEASLRHLGVFATTSEPLAQTEPPPAEANALIEEEPLATAIEQTSERAQSALPNLKGLSLRQAARRLWEGRWQVEASGWGRVVKQTPPPGSHLLPGETVRLVLAPSPLPAAERTVKPLEEKSAAGRLAAENLTAGVH